MKLTIVISTYNRTRDLGRALESVVRQTASPALWECVVVNNNSTDTTTADFAAFAAAHPDFRLRMVHEPKQGLSNARNCGVAAAQGEYIGFCDADDWIEPPMYEMLHRAAKQADADVIIIVACGERANEVVEIFAEFPELTDPRTGHKLMERTIIICNTSNMPVAAREASVYTGMTIGEYYRSMGLKVLVMADSTSRWAQALREMSNRLEELPGQDAFPMDLSAIISNFYSRAGLVKLTNGETGSVTFLGTVSPAGGNLKEPVTESTKKAARCFYALSQGRADSKRYPAIDPIDSYSKYLEYPEIRTYLDEHIEKDWVDLVYEGKTIVQRGKEANDQINILGDDGVPVDYHERFWKGELIDFVILQQDAFDDIDANCPIERQKMMYEMVLDVCHYDFEFDDFEACSHFFKSLINLFRQMNYAEWESEKFFDYKAQVEKMVNQQQHK